MSSIDIVRDACIPTGVWELCTVYRCDIIIYIAMHSTPFIMVPTAPQLYSINVYACIHILYSNGALCTLQHHQYARLWS